MEIVPSTIENIILGQVHPSAAKSPVTIKNNANEGSSFFCLLCVNFLVMISVAIAFLIIFKISSEAVPYISDCIDGKIPCDWNAGLSYTWRHSQSSVWSSTGNAAAMIQKWWFKS